MGDTKLIVRDKKLQNSNGITLWVIPHFSTYIILTFSKMCILWEVILNQLMVFFCYNKEKDTYLVKWKATRNFSDINCDMEKWWNDVNVYITVKYIRTHHTNISSSGKEKISMCYVILIENLVNITLLPWYHLF